MSRWAYGASAMLLAAVSSLSFCETARADAEWTLLIYYSVDYVDSGIGDRDQDRDRARDEVEGQDGSQAAQAQPQDRMGDDLSGHPYSTPEATMQTELSGLLDATSRSSNGVNIVVLVDKLTEEGTSVFEIIDGSTTTPLTWEERNTADPVVLEGFVTYGLSLYPSSKTALFITGEGHGWRGICRDRDYDDPDADEDLMSVHEIARALTNASVNTDGGIVDLLVFNGANMASIEVAYELRDTVPYMVATQSQIQEDGIPYSMFVADLVASPEMSVPEFATRIVNAHVEYYGSKKSGTSVKDTTRTSTDRGKGDCDRDRDNGEGADPAIEPDGGKGGANGSLGVDPGGTGDGLDQQRDGGGQIAQDFANMSAFDMSKINDVVVAHTEFSLILTDLMEDLHNVIPAARDASMVGHHNDISDYDYLSDIYTFVSMLEVFLDERREDEYTDLRNAIDAYRSAYDGALVAEAHSDKFNNTHGLSIWYPGSLNSYELRDSGNVELKFGETFFYEDPELALDFVEDSAWVDYLYAYYLAVGGHGSVQ